MSSKNGKKKSQSFDLSQSEIKKMLKKVPGGIRSYIDHLEKQVKNLADIGLSLSKEKDMNILLENILLEAKRIANADGGTLYMKTEDDSLRFEIMMTDSLKFHMGGTSGQDIPFYPIKLYEEDGKPNTHMISAYVGLTGETVNIPDAYEAEGFDFSGTKAFDEKTGYRSKSFLTVPLKNHEDEIIGVLQLLNALDKKTNKSIPFSSEIQDIVEALSSQAAVAITNKNLIRDLEILFESFIKLIASAIDAKSPYTGGHCSRVPEITMMLTQ
ncbi:MAG TPA: GAF domain-containing protein, partial [Candidatus Marinimicrobia bacterium]|nr:GAF domain-containing protein [Candidatus Neomarinimicrobiota bacterium]